jgi:hypothetical protein
MIGAIAAAIVAAVTVIANRNAIGEFFGERDQYPLPRGARWFFAALFLGYGYINGCMQADLWDRWLDGDRESTEEGESSVSRVDAELDTAITAATDTCPRALRRKWTLLPGHRSPDAVGFRRNDAPASALTLPGKPPELHHDRFAGSLRRCWQLGEDANAFGLSVTSTSLGNPYRHNRRADGGWYPPP